VEVQIFNKNMPINKEQFLITQDDLQKAIDVDDSRGRSCPINMNFIEEGYLSKDTGSTLFGSVQPDLFHSLYNFKKKDGTSYIIGATGNKLKKYDTTISDWIDIVSTSSYSTGTISVDVTTGVVTGSGTTFTPAMVRGTLKSTTLTTPYLVTAYSSATSITIKDMDEVAYTGGAITNEAYTIKGINATMTIATPCVVSQTAHGLTTGSKITFSTTGALPTGVTAGTTYYVIATGLTADAFQFSTTLGGTAVNTSGTQSGIHSITRLYTANAEFGYQVYDDNLYFCNGVDNFTKWTGDAFTETGAPKGNILEIFEDRMFVSGVSAEPLSIYYSKTAEPTNFTIAPNGGGVLKPLGTDFVTNLENYYGQLLIFKSDSIWKMTFV